MSEDWIKSPTTAGGGVGSILTGSSSAKEINSEEEQKVAKAVQSMFLKAKSAKGVRSKNYEHWWNLWEGNHYKGRPSRTVTEATINQSWSAVETFLGHISDIIPSPLTQARLPQYKQKAQTVRKWLEYVAESNNVQTNIQHPLRSAAVVGEGWFRVDWDPQMFRNKGDVSIYPVDEKFIYPGPYATNMRELLYLIEARNIPREWVEWRFKERGQLVPVGGADPSLSNLRTYSSGTGSPGYQNFTSDDGSQSQWSKPSGTDSEGGKGGELVTFIECWTKQDDGSMRYTVVANGLVLQDGPSPYNDDDFPFVLFTLIPTLDSIQGRSLMQFIEGLQDILNDSMSLILDQQKFCSDPMMVVHTANIEEMQNLENTPGAILPDASGQPGAGYQWLQAPGLNPAWLQVQEIANSYMDSVLGRVDILRGERPVGVNTLGGMEIVKDQANVRLRNLARWVNASLKRMFLLALSRLKQFAKDERTLLVQGKGNQPEYVKVNEVQGVNPNGTIQQDETLPDDAEFEISFGREKEGGKQAEIELALALAGTPAEDGLPMVDRRYVLDKCDQEEAESVIERMDAMAQAQAQAQQQQAQAPGTGMEQGAPPGPGGMQQGQPPQQQQGDPLDTATNLLMGYS